MKVIYLSDAKGGFIAVTFVLLVVAFFDIAGSGKYKISQMLTNKFIWLYFLLDLLILFLKHSCSRLKTIFEKKRRLVIQLQCAGSDKNGTKSNSINWVLLG